MAVPLWIDCDTGVDDALGLLLALGRPDVQLVGVSVTAGNCPLEDAVANTLGVLTLGGGGRIPVHPGARRPLLEPLRPARAMHGDDGIGGLRSVLPPPIASASTLPAAPALWAAALACDGELTVVTTGPLSNLAAAAVAYPELPPRIRHVVLMGGAVTVAGNVTATAEFNIATDPEAASIVLRAGWPLTVVGLDVTMTVLVGPAVAEALSHRAEPGPRFCAQALRFYQEAYRRQIGRPQAPMHDPLAVAVALDPTLVETVTCPVEVETEGRWSRGTLLTDRRLEPARPVGWPTARVALRVDAHRAVQGMMDAWAR